MKAKDLKKDLKKKFDKQIKDIVAESLKIGLTLKVGESVIYLALMEARKSVVMAHFFEGKNDREIAEITGFSTNVVGKITREYWSENELKNRVK